MKKILLNGLLNGLMSSAGIVVGTCLVLNEGMAAEGGGDAGGPEIPVPDVAGVNIPPVEDPIAAADKAAADKAAADKAAADKAAADKAAADKAAADKAAADKAAADKAAADKAAADKIAADKIAADKIAADKERKRLERETAKRAAAASTPLFSSTTSSIKPTHELSEEEENNQYKKTLSDIRGKINGCTSRSDCLEKSKTVFNAVRKSLETKTSYENRDVRTIYTVPVLEDEPDLKEIEKTVRRASRPYKKDGENEDTFNRRYVQPRIDDAWEDALQKHKKAIKKYDEDNTIWQNQLKQKKNQTIREKTKKMVENLQTFFQSVYDKEIFPTQVLIYEHLSESGKKDYLAHRLVTDPLKVRIYADETTQTTGKKKDDNAMWSKIGAGAIGTIIGGMLAPSTPSTPAPAPGTQRPGQRPGTSQQGYQSPYATPKPGTQPQKPAQRSTTPGAYSSTPARPQQPQKYGQSQQPQNPQQSQPYGRYQNNSYAVGEGGVFLQPIVFGEANGYDYSYGSKKSYGSSSSSYSSSSAPAGMKEIPPKEYRFNKDDVLLFAMDEIEKKHRSCSNHKDCLKQDSDRVAAIANGLGEKDPSRDVLLEIADEIESRGNVSYVGADKIIQAFEDAGYEGGGSALKSKLREEWESIASTRSKSRTSREPKVANEADLKKSHAKVIRAEEKKTEKKQGYRDGYSQQEKRQEPAKKEEGGLMGMFGKLFGGK